MVLNRGGYSRDRKGDGHQQHPTSLTKQSRRLSLPVESWVVRVFTGCVRWRSLKVRDVDLVWVSGVIKSMAFISTPQKSNNLDSCWDLHLVRCSGFGACDPALLSYRSYRCSLRPSYSTFAQVFSLGPELACRKDASWLMASRNTEVIRVAES